MTRYVALLYSPTPLGGRCPSCEELMDESGCRLGDHYQVRPAARRRTGIAQVVEVFCEGTPTAPVRECPCCAEHPGAPCDRT